MKINEGTLKIEGLKNGDQPSALGASSSDPSNLVLNGGTLRLSGTGSISNRGMTIGSNGGTLSLAGISPHLTLTGNISGEGQLTKIGNGNLTISLPMIGPEDCWYRTALSFWAPKKLI